MECKCCKLKTNRTTACIEYYHNDMQKVQKSTIVQLIKICSHGATGLRRKRLRSVP